MDRSRFTVFSMIAVLLLLSGIAVAQPPHPDMGDYVILSAQYGTAEHHVDVTHRLRELARMDQPFRMGNSTFGEDPDRGRVKVLRIYARGPHGNERMFEYREGSWVDGRIFRGWNRGDWGQGGWSGRWDAESGVYTILGARYGTPRRNVDVTERLRELARADITFRMGNGTWGVDPDPGHVKTLRIYARGPQGNTRMFEYREGAIVDGAIFRAWGHGEWARERWNGGWDVDRDHDHDRDHHDHDHDRDRD